MRWLVVLLALAACSKKAEPVVAECTLATPLVPGIPGSPGHLIASERNPNGASELATLMRRFVDDWKEARATMKVAPRWPVHRQMRCAWPTDVADRNQAFDALAVRYLDAVKAYDARPARDTYSGVIDGCVACHEVTCGGPLEIIEQLR